MDSTTLLALMTKAKLVFETSDTFLSFPALTPIAFPASHLDFTHLGTSDALAAFADFCRLTNMLPNEGLFQADADLHLWDVYSDVLSKAQVAGGNLTPQQQQQLQAAEAVLYTSTPDGLQAPTQAVSAYNQYQAAWQTATQDYKTKQIAAQMSTDPTVQAQWQTAEPALRAAVQAAENDWESKGFKAQVESARQVEQAFAAQSPGLQWQSWSSQFVPALDLMTDQAAQSFAITGFSPSDILNEQNWPTFTLSGTEIASLIEQAPPELKAALDTGAGASGVTSLSFEFCSVVLSRPWLKPELFSARFWRFADPHAVPLSDGKTPAAGQWPAYASGIVFARNIKVTTQAAQGGTQVLPARGFEPVVLRQNMPGAVHPVLLHTTPVRPVATRTLVAARPMVTTAPLHPSTAATATAVSPATLARLHATTFPTTNIIRFRPILPTPVGQGTGGNTQPPQNAPTTSKDPSISILAFICKRLPQSPNPDPSLSWAN